MYEKLKTRRARRIYITAFVLIVIVLIGILFLLEYLKTKTFDIDIYLLFQRVVIGLVSLLIIASIYFLLIDFLIPIEESIESVQIIDTVQTGGMHKNTLRNTEFWYHDGHLGRWVRNEVFKEFLSDVKGNGGHKKVILAILNPSNDEVCKAYSIYRQAIGAEGKSFKSVLDTKEEILATIILAQSMFQNNNNVDIQIFFKDYFEISRFDFSDEMLFETLPDPRCSAIVYLDNKNLSKSNFYKSKRNGFINKTSFLEELPLNQNRIESLTLNNVKEYIEALKFNVPNNDRFIRNIIKRAKSSYHPYN